MAVAHAFHHDSRAIRTALENATTGTAPVFIGEHGGGHLLPAALQVHAAAVAGNAVFSDPRSELTFHNNDDASYFVQRKRAHTGDAAGACLIMEGHRALLPVPQPLAPAEDVRGSRSRVLCSGAASTSGRPAGGAAPVSQHGVLAHLYRHTVEIDALVRAENERLRAGLEEARRRHVQAVVSAVERAAARRLRAAEADLERALARNAELSDKVRQMDAEGQVWQGVASGHEAAAAGLRATLEQLLQTPCAGAADEGQGEVEDARSCCFEQEQEGVGSGTRACRWCGAAEACVLLLPCRHLCLCRGCEARAEACPVCATTKNASLHVLLS